MAFSSSTVSIGANTKKSDYDRLLDNAQNNRSRASSLESRASSLESRASSLESRASSLESGTVAISHSEIQTFNSSTVFNETATFNTIKAATIDTGSGAQEVFNPPVINNARTSGLTSNVYVPSINIGQVGIYAVSGTVSGVNLSLKLPTTGTYSFSVVGNTDVTSVGEIANSDASAAASTTICTSSVGDICRVLVIYRRLT